MSKLFKLKKWLTINDASVHLSTILDETVHDYDILRFALDGHLKLSVQLVNAVFARRVVEVDFKKVEFFEIPTLDGKGVINIAKGGSLFSDERGNCQILETVTELDTDVWELMLYGGARLNVEHLYQMKTSGVAVTAVNIDGDVMVKNNLGNMFMLMNYFESAHKNVSESANYNDNFYPAGRLPEDAVLVVTTQAITDFLRSLSEPNLESEPLLNTERETPLVIIAALAKEAKVDITKTSKAGDLISNMTQLFGAPVGATTIETHLKKIPQALLSRAK